VRDPLKVVALTGTPGCGKTQTAKQLEKQGFKVIYINKFARKCGALTAYIEEMDTWEIDINLLSRKIRSTISPLEDKHGCVLLEGHLAHHVSCVTEIIVLRCAPSVLYKRLLKKHWKRDKVWENVEAEVIDLILLEAMQTGKAVYEVDTTHMSAEKTAEVVKDIIEEGNKEYKPGRISWSADFITLMESVKDAGKLQKKSGPVHRKHC
jgi:adenylate kinase